MHQHQATKPSQHLIQHASPQRVDIVFYGEIATGFTLPTAKQGFTKLFSLTDAKVEQIFAARKVTLKPDLDQAVAAKYQQKLERAGVLVRLEPRLPTALARESVAVDAQPVAASAPVATLISAPVDAAPVVATQANAGAQPSPSAIPTPLRRKLPPAEELTFGFKVKRWLGLV